MGNSGHVIFCQDFPHNEGGVCRHIVMVQQPVSVLPHLRPFAPHIFLHSSQNLTIKLGSTSYRRTLCLLLSSYVYRPELAILRKILFVLYQSRTLSQYFTTTLNTSKVQESPLWSAEDRNLKNGCTTDVISD